MVPQQGSILKDLVNGMYKVNARSGQSSGRTCRVDGAFSMFS